MEVLQEELLCHPTNASAAVKSRQLPLARLRLCKGSSKGLQTILTLMRSLHCQLNLVHGHLQP